MANPTISGNYLNVPNHLYSHFQQQIEDALGFPEEIEESDRAQIIRLVKKYFEDNYPSFEPEVVHGTEKDYFLPALKVLRYAEGQYWSPGYEEQWKDGELKASCHNHRLGGTWIMSIDENLPESVQYHDAPGDECDCGIYGSVNLDEIAEYLQSEPTLKHRPTLRAAPPPNQLSVSNYAEYQSSYLRYLDYHQSEIRNVLCLIEPQPDAKVILCRKGWKASHAFISEIIGKTMNVRDASQLLSIAWQRNIDIRSLKVENR